MLLRNFFISILILIGAQSKSEICFNLIKPDSITHTHSPKKAATLSAILPGLGQAYNQKYWKMPIIYVGFIGLGYAVIYNHNAYTEYLNAYKKAINNPTNDPQYTNYTANLNLYQNAYHRYRDLSIIGCAALYILNIIDANVDANLFSFDVSDDLSLKIQPAILNFSNNTTATRGLSLKITL